MDFPSASAWCTLSMYRNGDYTFLRPRRDASPRPSCERTCCRYWSSTSAGHGCASSRPLSTANGLRRRRGSLHYKRTGSLTDVATLLGDSKRVAADHHVYALTDYREVNRTIALARLQIA